MSPAPASVTPLTAARRRRSDRARLRLFARLYEEGVAQVAWTRLVADLETPVSAMLKLAHERAE